MKTDPNTPDGTELKKKPHVWSNNPSFTYYEEYSRCGVQIVSTYIAGAYQTQIEIICMDVPFFTPAQLSDIGHFISTSAQILKDSAPPLESHGQPPT